jgi:hypothetical protein
MRDDALVARVTEDFEAAPLAEADKAMLRYACKLTQTPEAMNEADVTTLREAGWDDAAILDICQITGYNVSSTDWPTASACPWSRSSSPSPPCEPST